MTDVATKVLQWQHCRHTSPLLCHMDPDHPPMEFSGGFFMCIEETCGYIRRDAVSDIVLNFVHRENHHGCHPLEDS
jgi:hypothetical protein